MRRFILYANGNSENHGCEALTRTVCKLFEGNPIHEYVNNISTDSRYHISCIVERSELESPSVLLSPLVNLSYKIAYKLKLHNIYNYHRYYDFLQVLTQNDIALSIGGDNYCYPDITWLQSLNYWITKKTKTVLLGVSIEPSALESKALRRDLQRYSLIIARESLTYESLKTWGFGARSVFLPDPAFLLETDPTDLPANFVRGNTVGINISPMIMDYEKNKGMTYQNYETLIRHILDTTDMTIALIPHVVWKNSDDRVPLQQLYDSFQSSGRICMIEDQNCMRLKYVISQCRFFIGARTHATIAAYSTCVPTLVVGYSVKAKGIATDLFGTYENYVIPVQTLTHSHELTSAFSWLQNNEKAVREHLNAFIPGYRQRVHAIPVALSQLSSGE